MLLIPTDTTVSLFIIAFALTNTFTFDTALATRVEYCFTVHAVSVALVAFVRPATSLLRCS